MNAPVSGFNLPWLAALTAVVVTLLWHCVTFGAMVSMAPSDNEVILANVGATLRGLGEGMLLQGGLAFLVVHWLGERGQRIAYARPTLPLLTFGGLLLVLHVAVMLMYQAAFITLATRIEARWLHLSLMLADLAVDIAGIWLAWRITLRVHRGQASALPPAHDQKWRAAGLAAWVQAAATVLAAYLVALLIGTYELYQSGAWLLIWAGALLCAALAFGGAWLALPRQLPRVYVGRVLGAGLLTLVCAQALVFFAGVVAVVWLAWGARDTIGAIMFAGALCLLSMLSVFGFQWLWTRVCYAGPRRAAAI